MTKIVIEQQVSKKNISKVLEAKPRIYFGDPAKFSVHTQMNLKDLSEEDYQKIYRFIVATVYFSKKERKLMLENQYVEEIYQYLIHSFSKKKIDKNKAYEWSSKNLLNALNKKSIQKTLKDKNLAPREKLSLYIPSLVVKMLQEGVLALFIKDEHSDIRLGMSEVNKAVLPSDRWEEYIKGVGRRFAPDQDPAVQSRVSELFRQTREANGVFSTLLEQKKLIIVGDQDVDKAVFITKGVSLDGAGLKITSGILFTFSHTGYMREYRPKAQDLFFNAEDMFLILNMSHELYEVTPQDPHRNPINYVGYAEKTIVAKLLPRVQVFPCGLNLELNIKEAFAFYNIPASPKAISGFATALRRGKTRNLFPVMSWALSQCMKYDFQPEFRKLMSVTDIKHYNWFCQGNVEWRRQAVQSHPALSGLIINSDMLTRAIDCGEPIAPILQKMTGFSPKLLKTIKVQNWQRMGGDIYRGLNDIDGGRTIYHQGEDDFYIQGIGGEEYNTIMSLVLNSSQQLLPSCKKDWKGLFNWTQTLNGLVIIEEDPVVDWKTFIHINSNRLSANWSQYTEGVFRQDRLIYDFVQNLSHVFSRLFKDCRDKAPEYFEFKNPLESYVSYIIFGKLPSWKSLKRQANNWHQRSTWLADRMTAIGRMTDTKELHITQWYAPMPNWKGQDGSSINWLTTDTALHEETQQMNHCVWSYVETCLYRGSHILSLRGPNGERSTAQLVFDKEENDLKKKLIIVQHQGPHNHKPEAVCEEMLVTYINGIRELIDYPEAELQLQNQKKTIYKQNEFEYPRRKSWYVDNIEQSNAVWETYQIFLEGEFRNMSLAEAKDHLYLMMMNHAKTLA